MSDARHHHAARPAIIFVEVPAAGSQENTRRAKPAPFPADKRAPWRPQRAIPHRSSNAEATVRLINAIARQDVEVRDFMRRAREGG
jgi:hypothetical protein